MIGFYMGKFGRKENQHDGVEKLELDARVCPVRRYGDSGRTSQTLSPAWAYTVGFGTTTRTRIYLEREVTLAEVPKSHDYATADRPLHIRPADSPGKQ